mgnify:CR=1 FL=1
MFTLSRVRTLRLLPGARIARDFFATDCDDDNFAGRFVQASDGRAAADLLELVAIAAKRGPFLRPVFHPGEHQGTAQNECAEDLQPAAALRFFFRRIFVSSGHVNAWSEFGHALTYRRRRLRSISRIPRGIGDVAQNSVNRGKFTRRLLLR